MELEQELHDIQNKFNNDDRFGIKIAKKLDKKNERERAKSTKRN